MSLRTKAVGAGLGALFCMTTAATADQSWSGKLICSYGAGALQLNVDASGAVSGQATNARITSGRVSGSSVTFDFANAMGNRGTFTGTVSGTSMSGTYSQSAGTRETCRWHAALVSGEAKDQIDTANSIIDGLGRVRSGQIKEARPPAAPPPPQRAEPKPDDGHKAAEKEGRDLYARAQAASRNCTYNDQMNAAGLLLQAAGTFDRAGNTAAAAKVRQASVEISKPGGTAERCRARQQAETARKPKPGKLGDKECRANLQQLQKLMDAGGDADLIATARSKLAADGCK